MRSLAVAIGLLALTAARVVAQPCPAPDERDRIRAHLARTEAALRASTPADLAPELRAARDVNLDRLHAYWVRGEFPHNPDFPGECVPYFIDDRGVACAVADLVIGSGHRALAERLSRAANNAYLPDIHDPELDAWIAASGLTAEEHALIQPTYCLWTLCDGIPDGTPCTGCGVRDGTCMGSDCVGGVWTGEWPFPGCDADAGIGCPDDGQLCTTEICVGFGWGCGVERDDTVCDDFDPCTIDRCDIRVGCVHTVACTTGGCSSDPAEGRGCDDGEACTSDWCAGGECRAVVLEGAICRLPGEDAGAPDGGAFVEDAGVLFDGGADGGLDAGARRDAGRRDAGRDGGRDASLDAASERPTSSPTCGCRVSVHRDVPFALVLVLVVVAWRRRS